MSRMDQKLLAISLNQRTHFYKIWNRISRSEETGFLSAFQKLELVLRELEASSVEHLPPDIRFISMTCEDYPSDLLELPQPPIGLYVRGDLKVDFPRAAVVGSRKPSPYSLRMAYRSAQIWAKRGFIIVSGGAMGVDTEAHRAALDTESPTWVILGGGLLKLHPRSNLRLFDSVVRSGGALISEYPPHWEPRAHYFPERNRIIAALSNVLFLAQAHEKSGSLSTARIALEMGREIFVLRPPPADEAFAGSQKLIDLGARCLIDPQELIQDFGRESVPEIERP